MLQLLRVTCNTSCTISQSGGLMKGKVIGALVVAFLIYFVFTKPQEAAEGVNAGADKMGDGASSLGTFISTLGPAALGIIALVGVAWWLLKK